MSLNETQNSFSNRDVPGSQESLFHGPALARDPWLERYGGWIALGFTIALVLFLLGMVAAGNVPGQSFPLKSGSDIIQFVGETIGFLFCLRIALRLRRVSRQLQHKFDQQEAEHSSPNELITARTEVRLARRIWLAWGLLALGCALYAFGQAIWTSYDVRMPTSQIPLPGLYNLGFSGAYPFFLIGTLLLTRRSRATIGHVQLLLDALAVFVAAFAISWFFVLGPTIAELSGGFWAEFFSIYVPASDLFLAAVATFLMFSPLSSRHQQPVFLRLCLGIFSLAITDGLLGYFSLSPSGFNTGTLQDTLWPLSMLFIGLAAIEYPRSVAREQALVARQANPSLADLPLLAPGRFTRITTTLQTAAPFLLALLTCTVLLTTVAPRGGSILIQSSLAALALILIVVIRQTLTLIENNWLNMQMHGELVLSQRELQVKQQEAITDAITGLPSHRAIMSHIDAEVARCQRGQSSCAVLFVDLDHFKHINDTWSHRAGDAILHEVGSRLSATVGTEDFVGRYGGEEFAVVLTNTDLSKASETAEQLRLAVGRQAYYWETEDALTIVPIEITTSIGVAIYGLHGMSRESLIESADQAMYRAKHTGRNRVCIADIETEPVPAQNIVAATGSEQAKETVAVRALAAAASARDYGTSAHSQRMVRLAEATARMLGRPGEELHLIRLGALLHDIGKIGIPDSILLKPGPLTDKEWTVMRRHPEIGRHILEQIGGIFECLAHIVVAHHERWDGHGYPNRLAKEAIPMSARILAVVDSYDAMTSQRPYREPMTAAEARAELQRCTGKQYDPLVVDAFLSVLDQEAAGQLQVEAPGIVEEQRVLNAEAPSRVEANSEARPLDTSIGQEPARV